MTTPLPYQELTAPQLAEQARALVETTFPPDQRQSLVSYSHAIATIMTEYASESGFEESARRLIDDALDHAYGNGFLGGELRHPDFATHAATAIMAVIGDSLLVEDGVAFAEVGATVA